MTRQARNRQEGFTLVEALVALLVMAFGMLALAGLQSSMSRNADVAKQRTEAIRLAEQKLECLRSYTQIASATSASVNCNGASAVLAWNDLATNTTGDTFTSNATFTRTWTLGGATTDTSRPISVNVAWTDRTGAAQSVTVNSVISNTDPSDTGFLGFPLPLNTTIRRPRNRNINIPIPAYELGGGLSGINVGSSAIVFNDVSGSVVQICSFNLNVSSTSGAVAGCPTLNAFIVDGYVSQSGTSTWPTGINTAGLTVYDTSHSVLCSFGDATDQTTNTTISGYKYYLCVIPVSALTTPPSVWSGTIRLGGVPTTGTNIVCRYQYTSTLNTTPNEQNMQPYASVNESLDEQNYMMATSSSNVTTSLAGSTTVCPSSMTVSGTSVGVVHQDCRLKNTARGTECP